MTTGKNPKRVPPVPFIDIESLNEPMNPKGKNMPSKKKRPATPRPNKFIEKEIARVKIIGPPIGTPDEPDDGDGDGFYTAFPGAGDKTPVPPNAREYRPARIIAKNAEQVIDVLEKHEEMLLQKKKPGSGESDLVTADGDWMMSNIYELQGFLKSLPRVVDSPENLPDGEQRMYRGIGQSESGPIKQLIAYAEQFRSGLHFAGQGVMGAGTYIGDSRTAAIRDYASWEEWDRGKEGPRTLLTMSVSPNAKLLDRDEADELVDVVERLLNERYDRIRYRQYEKMLSDPGRLAALMGYDGIVRVRKFDRILQPSWRDDDFVKVMTIFNRTALTVVADPKTKK